MSFRNVRRSCGLWLGMVIACVAALVSPLRSEAATVTFDSDSDGANGVTEQPGIFNWLPGVSTNFYNGTPTTVFTVNNLVTDVARFGNGGVLSSAPTINVGSGSINGLIFGATTSNGYVLSALSAQTLSIGSSGVAVEIGAQTTTLGSADLTLRLGAAQTWTNSSTSLLTIDGAMQLGGNALTLNNASSGGLTFLRNLSGTGSITVTSGSSAVVTLAAVNTYTGATNIDSGTLYAAVANALPSNTVVRLGNGAGSTTATLDLSGGSQTIAGLNVQTSSTLATNHLVIGSGTTLTVNGAVNVGISGTGTTHFTALGGGSLVVNYSGVAGTGFLIGIGNGSNNNFANVNLSALNSLTANLGTNGTFRVGDASNGGTYGGSTLTGAVNNSVTASTIRVGDSSGPNSSAYTFVLGSGNNYFGANTINIGSSGTPGYRSGGTLMFAAGDTTGSLTIRGLAGGNSRADLNMINQLGSGNGNVFTSQVLLAGHTVDARIGNFVMASSQANGGKTAVFTFDRGTLDVLNWTMGARTAAGAGASNASTATVTLGDSDPLGTPTVTVGTLTMAVSTNTTLAHPVNAVLSVVGSDVTIGTGAGTAVLMGQTIAGRTVSAAITLTGGSLSLLGDIIRSGVGTENTTFTLSGGTLNMNGFNIGSSAAAIGSGTGSLNWMAGTVMNLGEVNGGGTFTKTGVGTLTMAGTNAYSGATSISRGTLIISGTNTGAGEITLSGGTVLQIGVGGASGSVSATSIVNNSSLVFNRSNASNFNGVISSTGTVTVTGGGDLTLGGNNTYSGATSVASGTLIVAGSLANSAVTVGVGASLSGQGALGGNVNNRGTLLGDLSIGGVVTSQAGAAITPGTLGTVGTLTLGGLVLNGGSLNFDLGSLHDQVRILTGGTVNVTASTGFNFNQLAGFGIGNYDLISGYSSLAGFGNLWTPTTVGSFTVSLSDLGSVLRLTVTGAAPIGPQSLVWTGASTPTWNTSDSNWTGSSSIYTDGASVAFDDTSLVNTLTIAGSVAPGHIVVNTANTYTIHGGPITGTADLLKQGAGTLVLTGDHGFTGPTTVAGGTLQLGGNYQANIDVQNALVQFNTTGNQTVTGVISGSGYLQKLGSGTTTLFAQNTFSGITSIDAGTLVVNHALSGTVFVNAGGAFSGSGASASSIVVQGGSGSITGTQSGAVAVSSGNVTIENGGVATGTVTVNGGTLTALSGATVGNALGININSGTFEVQSGATVGGGGTMNVAGTLRADGDVQGLVVVQSGGLVNGNGSVGALAVQSGGTLSVGHSVGTLTLDGNGLGNVPALQLDAGSTLVFEFNDALGGPGTGWDYIELGAGTLTLNATAIGSDKINIRIDSLIGAVHGTAANFAATPGTTVGGIEEYYWKFIGMTDTGNIQKGGYGSISGHFQIIDDLAGMGVFYDGMTTNGNPFQRPVSHLGQGTFNVVAGNFGQGEGLYIRYSAIPEPGSMLLTGLGTLAAGWYGKRRRRLQRTE